MIDVFPSTPSSSLTTSSSFNFETAIPPHLSIEFMKSMTLNRKNSFSSPAILGSKKDQLLSKSVEPPLPPLAAAESKVRDDSMFGVPAHDVSDDFYGFYSRKSRRYFDSNNRGLRRSSSDFFEAFEAEIEDDRERGDQMVGDGEEDEEDDADRSKRRRRGSVQLKALDQVIETDYTPGFSRSKGDVKFLRSLYQNLTKTAQSRRRLIFYLFSLCILESCFSLILKAVHFKSRSGNFLEFISNVIESCGKMMIILISIHFFTASKKPFKKNYKQIAVAITLYGTAMLTRTFLADPTVSWFNISRNGYRNIIIPAIIAARKSVINWSQILFYHNLLCLMGICIWLVTAAADNNSKGRVIELQVSWYNFLVLLVDLFMFWLQAVVVESESFDRELILVGLKERTLEFYGNNNLKDSFFNGNLTKDLFYAMRNMRSLLMMQLEPGTAIIQDNNRDDERIGISKTLRALDFDSGQQEDLVNAILNSFQDLDYLYTNLNDLLKLSQSPTKLAIYNHLAELPILQPELCDLREMTYNLASDLSLQLGVPVIFDDKGLRATHATVLVEKEFLKKALTHLIQNAMRYADSGRITIQIQSGEEEQITKMEDNNDSGDGLEEPIAIPYHNIMEKSHSNNSSYNAASMAEIVTTDPRVRDINNNNNRNDAPSNTNSTNCTNITNSTNITVPKLFKVIDSQSMEAMIDLHQPSRERQNAMLHLSEKFNGRTLSRKAPMARINSLQKLLFFKGDPVQDNSISISTSNINNTNLDDRTSQSQSRSNNPSKSMLSLSNDKEQGKDHSHQFNHNQHHQPRSSSSTPSLVDYIFTVSDEGEGLDPEVWRALKKYKAPFMFRDNPDRRCQGKAGTGLGLLITSKIVDRLGGKFLMHSRKGVGTQAGFKLIGGRNRQ